MNVEYITFSCFMLSVNGRFEIFLYNVNDGNCVDGDDDSNDNDITKN